MPAFVGGDGHEAERVSRLRCAVLGVGAVGRGIALHLARMAPTALLLVDPKDYKWESLATQHIVPADVGRSKARSTAQACSEISPSSMVTAVKGGLETLDLGLFTDLDLVFLATDNLAAETYAAERCLGAGVPLIQGSVDGATLTAQVRLFRNADGQGPCPLCAFGDRERADLNRNVRYSCEAGVSHGQPDVTSVPTLSVSALCSLAADLAVLHAMRFALGLGKDVGDSMLEVNAYRWRSVLSPLKRRSDCPAEHRRWRVLDPPLALAECTLGQLADRAGYAAHVERASFEVDSARFYESCLCPEGHRQDLHRFLAFPGKSPRAVCGTCGRSALPSDFHSHRPVRGAALGPALDRPLEEVVDTQARWVLLRDDEQSTLFREPADSPASVRASGHRSESDNPSRAHIDDAV